MKNNHRFFIVALSMLVFAQAHAEKADSSKPIQITADTGNLDQLKGTTVWQGNVVVVQGTLKLNSDKVIVTQDKQGNQTLTATGRIVTFRQRLDEKDQWVEGQSSRLDYNSSAHTAILTGNARVKRGEDLVIGDIITYNTIDETYQVNGGSDKALNKGRVTVILQPKPASSEPSSPATKTTGKP